MPIFILIFFLLLVAYLLQIDFYHHAWKKLEEPDFAGMKPVTKISVLIPVRNEAKNLPGLIESLEKQTYPPDLFEVIIIDDHSTDETWEIIQSVTHTRFSLRPFQLASLLEPGENTKSYKKKAIEKAVEMASGTLMVTTDGDCLLPPAWLEQIAAFHETYQVKFIAAPVKIAHGKSLLSKFQALDFLTLQGITGAAVSTGYHTMCNGANLAYEKPAFYAVNGFEGIDQLASGDDMFLMHKIARAFPGKAGFLKSRQAIVITLPEKSWRSFLSQRIRWSSKAGKYQDRKITRVLLLVYLLNLCYPILGVAAFFSGTWLFFFVLLLLGKVIIEFPFVFSIATFFGQRKLMRYFILFQPLHILYTLVAGALGQAGSFEWKNRRLK